MKKEEIRVSIPFWSGDGRYEYIKYFRKDNDYIDDLYELGFILVSAVGDPDIVSVFLLTHETENISLVEVHNEELSMFSFICENLRETMECYQCAIKFSYDFMKFNNSCVVKT